MEMDEVFIYAMIVLKIKKSAKKLYLGNVEIKATILSNLKT
jgi:hypothetical protein